MELTTPTVSEDAERQGRLGQSQKSKPANANAGHVEKDQNSVKIQTEVQANHAAIQELTAQVSSLTKSLEKALTPMVNVVTEKARPTVPASKQPAPKPEVKGKCQKCIFSRD